MSYLTYERLKPPRHTRDEYRDALVRIIQALDRMHGKTNLSPNVCYARDVARMMLAKEVIDSRDPDDRTTEDRPEA